MGKKINSQNITVEKSLIKRSLRRFGPRWDNNNKTDIEELGKANADWIYLAQNTEK